MPKNKNETLCVEDLRHAEYYEMQNTFDDLYAKSKNGDIFTHLMDIILSKKIYYWHIEISKQMQAVRQQEQTVQ